MNGQTSQPLARPIVPFIADLVCVLIFASAGKASHESGDSDWVVLTIVWPYALALAVAYAGLMWSGRDVRRVWPAGVQVLAVTYVLGMLLRAVSGRGLAIGFLVVAAAFLALTMLGWRSVAHLVRRRRTARLP